MTYASFLNRNGVFVSFHRKGRARRKGMVYLFDIKSFFMFSSDIGFSPQALVSTEPSRSRRNLLKFLFPSNKLTPIDRT